MTVLGPGGHGVVIATPDPRRASTDRLTLRAAGIEAATLPELGLSAEAAGESPDEAASFWSLVTRRPALTREGERLAIGRPDGKVVALEPPTLDSDLVLRGDPPPRRVAVFGGAWIEEGASDYARAMDLGRRLAEEGVQVVCGGYAGVMEAIARGAGDGRGVAVGVAIEEWADRVTPNRWVTHLAIARNLWARYPILADADAWVAFPGGVGTLAEVAICWNLMQMSIEPRPLVVVGERWGRVLDTLREELILVNPGDLDLVRHVPTAEEAVALVTG